MCGRTLWCAVLQGVVRARGARGRRDRGNDGIAGRERRQPPRVTQRRQGVAGHGGQSRRSLYRQCGRGGAGKALRASARAKQELGKGGVSTRKLRSTLGRKHERWPQTCCIIIFLTHKTHVDAANGLATDRASRRPSSPAREFALGRPAHAFFSSKKPPRPKTAATHTTRPAHIDTPSATWTTWHLYSSTARRDRRASRGIS